MKNFITTALTIPHLVEGGSYYDLHVREHLFRKSREEEIRKRCPDDSERRFKDRDSLREWLLEVPTEMYTLQERSSEDPLAGLIFYRHKQHELSKKKVTMGIRLYEGYAGRGLSREFFAGSLVLRQTIGADVVLAHERERGVEEGIWLAVEADNTVARGLYDSLGFVAVGQEPDTKRIVMEYDGR